MLHYLVYEGCAYPCNPAVIRFLRGSTPELQILLDAAVQGLRFVHNISDVDAALTVEVAGKSIDAPKRPRPVSSAAARCIKLF